MSDLTHNKSGPHPPSWNAEPGATLIGWFEGWTLGTDLDGETHPIAIVKNIDGKRFSVWCFYTTLREAFKRAAPESGDTIEIGRLPDCENNKGEFYRVYLVGSDHQLGYPLADIAPPVDEQLLIHEPPPIDEPPPGDWIFAQGEKP